MKILFYCDTVFGYGGVERMLSVIAQAMARDNDVTILCTDLRADTTMYGYDQSSVKFDYISYPEIKGLERTCCKGYSYIYKKVLPKHSITSEGYSKSFFLPNTCSSTMKTLMTWQKKWNRWSMKAIGKKSAINHFLTASCSALILQWQSGLNYFNKVT